MRVVAEADGLCSEVEQVEQGLVVNLDNLGVELELPPGSATFLDVTEQPLE